MKTPAHAPHGLDLATLCVHAGSGDPSASGALATPIYQSATFLLDEERLAGYAAGHPKTLIYTRTGNPSQWAVQEKLAALEGAEAALVFSSGMAAISSVVLALTEARDHVVSSCELYGGTRSLFSRELPACGRTVTFVDPRDLLAVEAAADDGARLLYFETLSNPMLRLIDLPALGAVARRRRIPLVVDATFTTPAGMRALQCGADVSIHSASKYLNGHSDLIAGAAAGPQAVMEKVRRHMLSLGGTLDPHACFLLERGMKTLALRMRAHQESATAVARWLEQHPRVKHVFYPLLPSHPDHALARKLLRNGGGMVTFVVAGGEEEACRLLERLQLIRSAASLGGVETLASMPSRTSHVHLSPAERLAQGVPPGTVRLSVGVESAADLVADLEQAFAVADRA